jgi:hypothetical protein
MPKVFVSYSWDDDSHNAWVLDMAVRLRRGGIDVTLDQWHVEPGDELPAFMERSVRESDFVLIVCTAKYKTKADARVGGVGYEGSVITGELVTGTTRRKFVPLLRGDLWKNAAPSWLLGAAYIDVRSDPDRASGFEELLKTIWSKRPPPPEIGPNPFGTVAKEESDSVPAAPATAVTVADGDRGSNDVVTDRLDELIAILNDRAERITANVGKNYKYASPASTSSNSNYFTNGILPA